MSKPNIIYIYADDLGRGMLSCYGQKYFQTPNIDRLSDEGLQFTHAYGCIFCAPSRASLLTGYHDAHAGRWTFTKGGLYRHMAEGTATFEDIAELINNTSFQERSDEVFLAQIAQHAGYATGEIGKLEWGFATTPERIRRHGWDYHYGYYDHQLCHGFYPPFLFENGEVVNIPGNTHPDCGKQPGDESPENAAIRHDMTGKVTYSQDLFNDKIVDFLRKHRDQPFFLFHPSQLPHGPIAVPEIHPGVKDVDGLTDFEKEYASMVLRLDDTVGIILDELDALGIADNTYVFFSSDNGHEIYAAQEGRTTKKRSLDGVRYDDITTRHTSELSGDVFNGNDGMAGLKWTSWEGGTRLPYIARCPGRIAPNTTNHMIANYDFMSTLAEIVGEQSPDWKDGESFLPTLHGNDQHSHAPVVVSSRLGPALTTDDGWKLRHISTTDGFQLYNVLNDYREENDLAAEYPDKVDQLGRQLLMACDGNFAYGNPDMHRAYYVHNQHACQEINE
ncbi:MAG: sulfatase-like hydrolase/transferase [Candidatus Latescibacteria bacterium]|jgi:arylsulfatase A-like enzyme|nr:sulfatase-like hydrolase/transferase [Candidatus Latescibacterota bacterium]